MKVYLTLFFFFLLLLNTEAQNNRGTFEQQLEELSQSKIGLNETFRIDASGLRLYEFIATIAEEHELNVSASPELDTVISSSFYDVVVKEIFSFLINRYNLEIEIVNGIIVFEKKKEEEKKPEPEPEKVIDVSFNKLNGFLSVKLKEDSLSDVAKKITTLSGRNIILAPEVKDQNVSAYILNRPFDQVVDMMAKSNNLQLEVDDNDFYYLSKKALTNPTETKTTSRRRASTRNNSSNRKSNVSSGEFTVDTDDKGFLKIAAYDASAIDIIKAVAETLKINYFLYDVPDETNRTTLVANGLSFDNLLDHIFNGKEFTYKKVDDLYLLGRHDTAGLRKTDLIQLQNRTIETVLETIPISLTETLEIKEFRDLNGFVVSGSPIQIQEFRDYVFEIDIVVPVIEIEVMIVQYQKSYDISTGLQLGIDKQERVTQGVLSPSTDVTLNAASTNNLIDAFNGLGWINLGKVTKDFYANLRALENNSLVKISSTPKLVTLNGHSANSSIGETSYYFEQNNTLINTGITDNILQSGTWKATEANLSLNITPIVSKDEHVTLEIEVEKSAFLGRAGENAPPDKSTQRFQSIVRVKNNEMILLGGLDELERENSGSGTPFLSRIPIIKWFFSNRTKRKGKSKLHIFIKPKVVY